MMYRRTHFKEHIMSPAALERPLFQHRVIASPLNMRIEPEPFAVLSERAFSRFLDQPVDPVISWLDSGCPRSRQVHSARRGVAALLMVIGIVLTAGFALTFEHNANADGTVVVRLAEIL